MSGYVLDASLTIGFCLGERPEAEIAAARLLLRSDETIIPRWWDAEVRNALVTNERRGRISSEHVDLWFTLLAQLPLNVDASANYHATLALCRTHRLTFYDALYLELAQRRQATLGTLDVALQRAAAAEGVPTIP